MSSTSGDPVASEVKTPLRKPRVDAAGRPLEHRVMQAITAIAIVIAWVFCATVIMRSLHGNDPAVPARALATVAVSAWLITEFVGGSRGLVWPASALGITGSISLGIAVAIATPELRASSGATKLSIIAGVSSLSMIMYLFRFRLPGLVSPVITFGVVALFLTFYGINKQTMAQIEGFSPRGILAALMDSPLWASVFGLLAAAAVSTARRLDLEGDDFGLASARPLHLVGAGVLALVVGRGLYNLAYPSDALLLMLVWVVGMLWAFRINRVAVMIGIHLAIVKPLILSTAGPIGYQLGAYTWTAVFVGVTILDLAIWPWLHQISMRRGWTLGPGGRIPRERDGWMWRYWPYA